MNQPAPIRVVIADDHTILREGVAKLLADYADVSVAGQAGNGPQALELVESLRPDVLVSDINMPSLSGFEILDQLRLRSIGTKVLFLTMLDTSEYIYKALRLGAAGYLTKDTVKDELVIAIRTVYGGKPYYGQSIMQTIVQSHLEQITEKKPDNKLHDLLSPRELEILHLVSEGLSSKQISEQLFISERTVANHRLNIMNKCGVSNTIELVKLYLNSTGGK